MALKPGFKTTEFALSLVSPVITVVSVVAAAEGYPFNVPKAIALVGGILGTALASHGYSTSRATVKQAEAYLLEPTSATPPVASGLDAALAVVTS